MHVKEMSNVIVFEKAKGKYKFHCQYEIKAMPASIAWQGTYSLQILANSYVVGLNTLLLVQIHC